MVIPSSCVSKAFCVVCTVASGVHPEIIMVMQLSASSAQMILFFSCYSASRKNNDLVFILNLFSCSVYRTMLNHNRQMSLFVKSVSRPSCHHLLCSDMIVL